MAMITSNNRGHCDLTDSLEVFPLVPTGGMVLVDGAFPTHSSLYGRPHIVTSPRIVDDHHPSFSRGPQKIVSPNDDTLVAQHFADLLLALVIPPQGIYKYCFSRLTSFSTLPRSLYN
jgi:hypothetical protein